jgi:hypothetical protein
MDVNDRSKACLEHLRQALNLQRNNGFYEPSDYIVKIEPGPTKIETSKVTGQQFVTCDKVLITTSWDREHPVELPVEMTSVGASMKEVMDWAAKNYLG